MLEAHPTEVRLSIGETLDVVDGICLDCGLMRVWQVSRFRRYEQNLTKGYPVLISAVSRVFVQDMQRAIGASSMGVLQFFLAWAGLVIVSIVTVAPQLVPKVLH